MKTINKKFKKFVDATPNAYCCVEEIRNILLKKDYIELYENEKWEELEEGKNYFVIRNDSSLIAFQNKKNNIKSGFNIVSTHTDSPSFSIKNNPEIYNSGYLKLNIGGYGSMINYSWFDRPLSIAGRVILCRNGIYEKKIINIDKDLLVIPSQALHINREVNINNPINVQTDMLPIISLSSENKLSDIIVDNLSDSGVMFDKICDYDLYLYNRDKARVIGYENEFIMGPRLDDLACLFPGLLGFVDSKNDNSINVFCAFNNEEIGSLTKQGADSTFLFDVLTRISTANGMDLMCALDNSIVVSADNAHAVHPNASQKSDLTSNVTLNGGIVIKHHINYTTDALTSSLFKDVCNDVEVPYQDFTCRSDMRCGSTLGGISQRHVSIDSVDIGLAQLAMHSANETIGSKDIGYMYKALLEFYQTSFIKEKNKVKVIKSTLQ